MIARLHNFTLDLLATAFRVGLIFVVLVVSGDAALRVAAQFAPTSWFFSLSRIDILPGGRVAIVYRASRAGNLPVQTVAELVGGGNQQPCASSGRRIIEAGTTEAVVPISRLLPDCRWGDVPSGIYWIEVTASYPASGAYDKTLTVRSTNALIVRDGMIIGSTVPAQDGRWPER